MSKHLNDDIMRISLLYQYLNSQDEYQKIYSCLKDAKKYYPNFEKWYHEKVIPDLINFKRELIIERRNKDIVGLSIIKLEENKLCTLKIMDRFQNRGLGLKLFEKSFKQLNTDKPFLTVSEEKLPEFKKIFDYYKFNLTSIHDSLYRDGKKEYFFNE